MPGHPWDAAPAARDRAAALGISSRVRFVGGMPQAEVATWLQAADFAIQPSYFEAFGIAAAEAMATGLPVIATDVGGFRDYVEPGVTGDRVPAKDVDALAGAIRAMVCDGNRRRQLGANARRAALRFDDDVVFKQFAALFDRLAPPPA
jgi:glycosyltransferase involved in cell wall biosynthesis